MQRREWMQWMAASTAAALAPGLARAHHGWGSFDQDRPLYLAGTAAVVKWQNPHAELMLDVPEQLSLPAGLAQRAVPAQTSPVDGPALLAKTTLPTRRERRWEIELAPLTRMRAWQVEPIQVGQRVEVVGFAAAGEKGEPVMRAEYLFLNGKAYGLRSSPA